MLKILLGITILFEFLDASNKDRIKMCANCHSHNDYLNEIPIYNAFNYGFKSIEVDIILNKEQLYVAHNWWYKKKNVFIENTYLDKLYKIYKKNNGDIYLNRSPLFLLVDIKRSANKTYEVLNNTLKNYKSMLTYMKDDSIYQGAVTIILSGNKPSIKYLKKANERYVFLDGRLTDLGKNISKKMMPLISVNWKNEFRWKGIEDISTKEKIHLFTLIEKVHQEGRMIRFWGAPDNIKSWKLLNSSHTDLINTDKTIELYNFITEQ